MERLVGCLVLALAIAAGLPERSAAGSCRAAKLCCQGRDSGCVIQKASPNAIIESPRDKPCYCDHACLRLGDCCADFNETCAVEDCGMSEWTEWAECDNKCGLGRQTRTRYVVRPARNGGKPCPEAEESLACQNYEACRRRARHFQVEEASFSSGGGAAPTLDSNFVPQITRGYCTAFTILKVSKGCRRRLDTVREGTRVCVWCREEGSPSPCQLEGASPAARFAGIGRWELRSREASRCHGKWVAETPAPAAEECGASRCQGGPLLAFL